MPQKRIMRPKETSFMLGIPLYHFITSSLFWFSFIYTFTQWNLELRTQFVPGKDSTLKLFDFRVKFPHLK
jgi:hypothetical protein